MEMRINRVCIWSFFIFLGFLGFGPIHLDENRPKWSIQAFLNKTFQSKYDSYFTENLRKRYSFIKAETSLDFLLFHEISTQTGIPVILGRNETLYEKNYLNHYFNVGDFKGDIPQLGTQSLSEQMQKVKSGYEQLKAHGKNLVLIIYPHKVWIYPELITDRWKLSNRLHEKALREQNEFFKALDQTGIPWVNGVALFQKLKNERPDLVLYSRGGSHWSSLGACLVWQEVFKKKYPSSEKVPVLDCKTDLGHLIDPKDDDIAKETGVDNIYGLKRFQQLVPSLSETQRKPKIHSSFTFIGTSFSQMLIQTIKRSGLELDPLYVSYYHDHSTPMSQILKSDWIIVEQQQGSKLYSNLELFFEDVVKK